MFYKNRNLIPFPLALLLIAAAVAGCQKEKERLQKTGEIAEEVRSTLAPAMMKRLFETIKNEGYAQAVAICSATAEKILPQKSAEFTGKYKSEGIKELLIRRVSLKVRNPKDTPNETERKILEQWETLETSPGADEDSPQQASLTTIREGKHFYALVPIRIVTPQCLKCHGTKNDLDPQAAQKIQELYPEDQATGYRMGQLRGAFSVRAEFE